MGTLRCFTCNNALGDFDDDPARVERALAYLRQPPDHEILARIRGRFFALAG